MNKHEDDNSNIAFKKIIKVSIICSVFLVIELVGGIIANSLAIISDAAHLFTDLFGFAVSIVALWIGKKKADEKYSYGFSRAEVIGALISVFTIWFLTLVLIQEAIERLLKPSEINAGVMLFTAVFGLICNLAMMNVLHSGHGHSHNCNHSSNSKKEYIPILLSESVLDIQMENSSTENLDEYRKINIVKIKEIGILIKIMIAVVTLIIRLN
jgi:cation diffusion facilitator family transporter